METEAPETKKKTRSETNTFIPHCGATALNKAIAAELWCETDIQYIHDA